MAERFLVGSFSEPGGMLASVATLRAAGVAVHDVFAPYPVHGLDAAMGIRRSRLPFVTLLAGLGGLCFALAFQSPPRPASSVTNSCCGPACSRASASSCPRSA